MPCQDQCGAVFLQLLVYGVSNGAIVALNAVGFTLAYAVARQMNLAHSYVFALTMVVVASLALALGVTTTSPALVRVTALLLLAVAGALCGAGLNALVERLAFRPFLGRRDPIAPLIASVACSFLLLGVAVRWPRDPVDFFDTYHQSTFLPLLAMPDLIPLVELGRSGVSFTTRDAFVLVFAALVVAALGALLTRTRTGLLLRATAEDVELTDLCGGNPGQAQLLAFVVAGGLAGCAATISATYYGGTVPIAQYGLRSGLIAITAAVLGGIGNPRGALLAGLLLSVFSSFSDYLLDAHWTPVLMLLLLVGLLVVRPTGLLQGAATAGSEEVPTLAAPALAVPPGQTARRLLVGALVLALAYPALEPIVGWSRLYTASSMLLLVTLAVGLSIVVSFAGLLDLGYAAFFAVGGYTAALLTSPGSALALALPLELRSFWLAVPLAGLVAAAFGLFFGLPSVRTRGEYLAVVTLAFGELLPMVLRQLGWAGGAIGLTAIPALRLVPWLPGSPLHTYLLAVWLAAAGCLLAARLATGRIGRAWAAVRDDEVAAATAGVGVSSFKLLAFVIGATYAGLAGAIAVGLTGYVAPNQFDFTLSMLVLAAVVLGARWGVVGVVLGALAIAALDRVLVDLLNAGLRTVGAALALPSLATVDLRGDNFLLVGAVLYLAVLLRSPRADGTPRFQPPIGRPARGGRPRLRAQKPALSPPA